MFTWQQEALEAGRGGVRARPLSSAASQRGAPARTSLRPWRPPSPTRKAAPAAREPRAARAWGPGGGEVNWTPRRTQPGSGERSALLKPRWFRMGNLAGKRESSAEKGSKDGDANRGESEKKRNLHGLSRETSEDNEVFGEADVEPNNETPSQDTAVTDSKRTADPKNAWPDASPADPGGRPHLVRLFSRDAPGREDNTFKDRPSESDELQTIQEDSAATPEGLDVMASQKRPSQRHGSKYLASASPMDHARHGFLPRHRDTGILDSLGRFFGGDRGVPKRGSGKVSSEE